MKVRVAFLRRDSNDDVVLDGEELEESFEIDSLPRIGEYVLIPEAWQTTLRGVISGLLPKRLEVVGIDHHWDFRLCSATVYLSTIRRNDK